MATQIVSNVRSAGLDVAYDFPTLGDGNCFYRSVIQQMQRTQIKTFLDSNFIFTDSYKLKIAIVNYVLSEDNFINNIEQSLLSKLLNVINNASAFQNINMKPLSENNFINNIEQSLLSKLHNVINNASVFRNINMKPLSENNFEK